MVMSSGAALHTMWKLVALLENYNKTSVHSGKPLFWVSINNEYVAQRKTRKV